MGFWFQSRFMQVKNNVTSGEKSRPDNEALPVSAGRRTAQGQDISSLGLGPALVVRSPVVELSIWTRTDVNKMNHQICPVMDLNTKYSDEQRKLIVMLFVYVRRRRNTE
ncbi:hypothetical protein RRG08_062714 [Elysia crispata]|uniref:Uncharacterized protein n=1 Tax=Elysia crispata TaxID=231223 RepID=A0AAE1ABP8_9GAST|nr:hypothetical protein RRG08_062714 [Elysia crispata]